MIHPGAKDLITQVIQQRVDRIGVADHISKKRFLPVDIRSEAVRCRDLQQRWHAGEFLCRAKNAVNSFRNPGCKVGGLEVLPVVFVDEKCVRIGTRGKPVRIHHLLSKRLAGKGIKGPGHIELMNAQKPTDRQIGPDVTVGIRVVVSPGLYAVKVVQHRKPQHVDRCR